LRQATSGGSGSGQEDDIVLVVIIVLVVLVILNDLVAVGHFRLPPAFCPPPAKLATQVQASFMRRIQVLLSLLVAGKVSQTQIENAPPHLRLLLLLLILPQIPLKNSPRDSVRPAPAAV